MLGPELGMNDGDFDGEMVGICVTPGAGWTDGRREGLGVGI